MLNNLIDNLSEPASYLYMLFAILSIGGGIVMLNSAKVVHMVASLAVTFVSLAGLYLMLGADFVAFVQVLIYAGAVSILMIFGIMLTKHRPDDGEEGAGPAGEARKAEGAAPAKSVPKEASSTGAVSTGAAPTEAASAAVPAEPPNARPGAEAADEPSRGPGPTWREDEEAPTVKRAPGHLHEILAAVGVLALFGFLYYAIQKASFPEAAAALPANTTLEIGKLLMSRYALPFEIMGILLTAAFVGAIVIAKREEE
ncbi:NADH-quinone oxidoreductase subunit J family protein [Gorillibacterium sp. sgz500922]|uniref:NADH-quinone oxidoreductase subunit J family protein n=1 Tax=Gorillibacterium sp. sgz500922 TaxID=3446694 RepID=UPI003F67AC18